MSVGSVAAVLVPSIVGGVVGEILLKKSHPIVGFVGGALAGYGATWLLSKKS